MTESQGTRRIAVTGASGFVGRQVVPALVQAGHQVTVFGRDRAQLEHLYPTLACRSYADLAVDLQGHDLVVHLAVLNNNSHEQASAFRTANVDFTADLLAASTSAGVGQFVNLSSTHALDPAASSPYASSKREAADLVRQAEGIEGINLYCPAIVGGQTAGKLAVLNRLPAFLRVPIRTAIVSLKPTLSTTTLAGLLLSLKPGQDERDLYPAEPMSQNPVYRLFQTLIDWGFALSVLILAGWLMVLLWIWIKLDSPGPGLFIQTRVGRSGKPFECYKFRTMKTGTVQTATHEAPIAAVTKIGSFLRRMKLDELPQILNLFRGEASLVGPRPCLPIQTELVQARSERGVLDINPGITGLAQVRGVDMSEPLKLARLDQQYVAYRSILMDISIIKATFLGRGGGDRVAKTQ